MYNNSGPGGLLSNIPPVVKNLLLINIILFFVTYVLQMPRFNIDLSWYLGIHYIKSPAFKPVQFITYMFMHGGFTHLFFNMFALWMFGRILEQQWGGKKFFIYYMVTGVGAIVIQMIVNWIEIKLMSGNLSQQHFDIVLNEGAEVMRQHKNYTDHYLGKLNAIYNGVTVGASGAVFGLLLAFGMLYPNVQLMLLFPPIPVKAKYFVIGYGAIELFMGVSNFSWDNIAHFAHLGGMIFGFILIKMWGKPNSFNRWN